MNLTSKTSLRYLIPTSLLGGGIVLGTMFAPLSISGAQTDDDSTDDTSQPSPERPGMPKDDQGRGGPGMPGGDHGRGDPGRGSMEALTELGLSFEDIMAGNEAGQTLVETAAAAGIT